MTMGRAQITGALFLLAAVPADAGAFSQSDLDAYTQAFALFEAGEREAGYAAAWRADDAEGRRVYEWLLLQRPDSGRGFADIAAFLRARPDWPQARTIQRRAEEALDATVTDAEAAAFFDAFPPVSSEGVERYAALLAARGAEAKAAGLVRSFWVDSTFGAVREREFLASVGRWIRAEDHAARLDRLLWAGDLDGAHRMLERVTPERRQLGQARIALQKRSRAAAQAAEAVPARLRNDDGLRYDLARWHRRREDLSSALALSDAPPSDPEFADIWWVERRILARKLIRDGRARDALVVAMNHGVEEGEDFAAAEFMAGWLRTRFLDDPLAGYTHFDRLFRGVTTPISLARGAYWAGRASEAVGDMDLADRWYAVAAARATAYYGQLAAARRGEAHPLVIGRAPEPTTADERAYEANDMVRAIRLLRRTGARQHIRPFFFALRGQLDSVGSQLLLGREMAQMGETNLALAMGKHLSYDGVIAPDLLFPTAPLEDGAEPEPALVLAVIRQESAFDADAVSRAGARGLMQLMPGTAKTVSGWLGLPYSKSRLTTDVSYNVALGRAYLAKRLEDFGGSYPLALAAYNAGAHRVEDWIADFGDPRDPQVDPVDWVELIPFTETKNYVMRILENVQIYRNILDQDRAGGGAFSR